MTMWLSISTPRYISKRIKTLIHELMLTLILNLYSLIHEHWWPILTTRAKKYKQPMSINMYNTYNVILSRHRKEWAINTFSQIPTYFIKTDEVILFFFFFDDSILYVEMQRPRKAKSIFQRTDLYYLISRLTIELQQ